MKITLSAIYVYHNTPNEIKKSIETLIHSLKKIRYEIIIIDNASFDKVPAELNNLAHVKIINNGKNCGYGKGLNQGVKIAQGKYLLLLNPDIEFDINSISNLLNKLKSNSKVGAIGPQLISEKGETLQSISGIPSLLQSLFVFSFIDKIWPSNPFSKKYHNLNLDRSTEQDVDVVSGACIMIKKALYDKVGGFDESFFMYFEEVDFCCRVKNAGYKILYLPQAKVMHLVGRSTQNKEWIEKTFEQSRFNFFAKYHGLMPAIIIESILRIIKPRNLPILIIVVISIFLSFYKLTERMIFIGDQGWFYLSARDMLINGQIPLVGIASSHPWLHQGPLWTYMMAGVFWLFGFNPVNGAYLTIILGTLSVLLIYIAGKEMFSKRIGLISALLYATSPLVIAHSRMPYHTSPIPLFTLLFIFSLYRWISGNSIFFPLSILFLTILYNFELATSTLWFVLLVILLYGIMRKKSWIKNIFNKNILIYSVIAFLIPMLPIIIYDFNHNFPQTLKFIIWIGYRVLRVFGFPDIHGEGPPIISDSMLSFSFSFYQRLVFSANNFVAFVILIFSSTMLLVNLLKRKKYELGFILLALWIIISLVGYFVNKTPSEAYLPILFPALIILLAFSFDRIMKLKKLFIPAVIAVILLTFVNAYVSVSDNYSEKGLNFYKRLAVIKEIVKEADGEKYNIIGSGEGSQFESFTMNYEYLAWWLRHAPSKSPQKLKFVIQENSTGVLLFKNE